MAGPEVTLDTREFEQRLKLYDIAIKAEAVKQMKQNGEDLLREASNLAPLDEGTLTDSGTTQTNATQGDIVTTVGFNTPYATRVHYEMVPAPFAKMQPGPRTRGKSGTEFGAAGGMYLQRPLVGKMQRYTAAIAKRLNVNVSRGS